MITVILLPGPNSLYCLTTAGRYGTRAALRVMAAIFIGDSTLMLLATGGAASLLRANPTLFHILQTAGGAYLAYLGIRLLHAAQQK